MSFFHAIYGNALQDIQGTAEVSDVLDGKTFQSRYSYNYKVGTMTNKEGITVESNDVTQDDDDALIGIPVRACYNTNSKIKVPIETLKNNLTGLAPEPIGTGGQSIDLNTATDLSQEVLDSLTSANFLVVCSSTVGDGGVVASQGGYYGNYYLKFYTNVSYDQSTHIAVGSARAVLAREERAEQEDPWGPIHNIGSRDVPCSVYLVL